MAAEQLQFILQSKAPAGMCRTCCKPLPRHSSVSTTWINNSQTSSRWAAVRRSRGPTKLGGRVRKKEVRDPPPIARMDRHRVSLSV